MLYTDVLMFFQFSNFMMLIKVVMLLLLVTTVHSRTCWRSFHNTYRCSDIAQVIFKDTFDSWSCKPIGKLYYNCTDKTSPPIPI